MSDLISTPSQAHTAVSNEAFEALIDLLATDGIEQDPSPLLVTQADATLRDPSGKLDFDKIRHMFASQHKHAEHLQNAKCHAPSSTLPNEDGGSDDKHLPMPSTVPSRTTSMSPKPTERPTAGHRRSSTFGSQPWTTIHENGATTKAEDVTTTLQPLSLDELNAALAGAHEEVRSLRQKYEELQALVAKRPGAEKRDRAKLVPSAAGDNKVVPGSGNGRVETRDAGFQAQPSAAPTSLPLDVPEEIADLSENEAKRALNALVRSLNLAPGIIGPMATRATPTSPAKCLSALNSTRQYDVASITRAVKFLGTVDELVWRRTLAPTGPRTLLPVYSEENMVALLARLELWERAVRRSARA